MGQVLGRGLGVSPAEDFEHWWRVRGEWVEEPNQRRGGESGVKRVMDAAGRLLYVKRQANHLHRSWRYPFGRPTGLREREALLALQALGVTVPRPVYCAARLDPDRRWRTVLVTEDLAGFQCIEDWYAGGGRERCGEVLHTRLLHCLGAMLARLHRARWQHGCLYAKHVFVRVGEGEDGRPRVETALLDLEKSRRRLSRRRAALHDLRQFRRHSSWNDVDWQQLVYGYQTAFGSAIKGL
ncbi:lipopolysaccharide kinase InaA family protein [Zestomonas carbonaria]|uniref:Protein InaA n=1 Tax=Zestomonas carbonaria TaxID=2762745 RepID=A0A7U7EMN0_9GAMM|nr:lipopolysaccharide kinase InaA family protein [Pseudomonas carbonaria]CAD5107834.1 Protein InaA [Pseudomonas carbonaria]